MIVELRNDKKSSRQFHDTLKYGCKEGLAKKSEKAGTGLSTISWRRKSGYSARPPD